MHISEKHGMRIIESLLALVKKSRFLQRLILIYGKVRRPEKITRITWFIITGIGSGIGALQKHVTMQHMK
jgi:hypothetical protein